MSQHIVFNLVFDKNSKMGSAIFVPFLPWKLRRINKRILPLLVLLTILNIILLGHSFLISLHWDSYASIYLQFFTFSMPQQHLDLALLLVGH